MDKPHSQHADRQRLSRWLLWRQGLAMSVVSALVLLVSWLVVERGFAWIESDRVEERLERAAAILRSSAQSMLATTRDYAGWDETLVFMTDGDAAYLERNLSTDSTTNIGVDWVAFVGPDRHVASAIYVTDSKHGLHLELPLIGQLEQMASAFKQDDIRLSGQSLLWVGDEPILVSYAAITNSARTRTGAGWLFFGRSLARGRHGETDAETDVRFDIAPFDPRQPALSRPATMVISREAGSSVGWRPMSPWPAALILSEPPAYTRQRESLLLWIAVSMLTLMALSVIWLARLIRKKVLQRLEHFVALADGNAFKNDATIRWPISGDDEIDQLAAALNTMMGRVEHHEQVLAYLASHDPLTELGNRRQLLVRLAEALEFLRLQPSASFCLVLVDLDKFKAINDSLGLPAGDRVLAVMGERIQSLLRGEDVAARLGGDEFAVLLADAAPGQASHFVERLLHELSQGIDYEEQFLFITASAGIAGLRPGLDAQRVLRQADQAMHQAKKSGGNAAQFFEETMLAEPASSLGQGSQAPTVTSIGGEAAG